MKHVGGLSVLRLSASDRGHPNQGASQRSVHEFVPRYPTFRIVENWRERWRLLRRITSSAELATALQRWPRRATIRSANGKQDPDWPDRYAGYIACEQAGKNYQGSDGAIKRCRCGANRYATTSSKRSIAGKSLERVLGHETIAAGIAGPEIADDVIEEISGSFGSHHGICANRASWKIASTWIRMALLGRQDFGSCRHHELPTI
jgi:hypothetical protein